MSTKLGLWIDHRKALVVAVTDKGEETRLVSASQPTITPTMIHVKLLFLLASLRQANKT